MRIAMVGCTESGFHTYTSEVSERTEVQKGKYLYGTWGCSGRDDPQEEEMMKDIIAWIQDAMELVGG